MMHSSRVRSARVSRNQIEAVTALVGSSERPCLLFDATGQVIAASKHPYGGSWTADPPPVLLELVSERDRKRLALKSGKVALTDEQAITLRVGDRLIPGLLRPLESCGGAMLFLGNAVAAQEPCASEPALEGRRDEVRELQTQVEILRAAFEASFDGLYVTDGEGTFILVNRSYKRATGWTPDTVVGMNVCEMVKKGWIDRSATMEAIRQGAPVTTIVQIRNGNRLITTANPVLDENGAVKYVVGNARRIADLLPIEAHWLPFLSRQTDKARRDEELKLWNAFIDSQNGGEGCALVGNSPAFREVIAAAVRASEFDSSVLIMGESGVGKGLLAHLIHHMSRRREGPFVEVNCGAIPESLLESELFGYEKGAFTNARADGKKGLIESAHQGTLFLDEISELPFSLQVKLLKFLDTMSFTPLGGVSRRTVDLKIIAASNVDLEQQVREGRFRHDLFFRLNVLPITIVPLRERREDIPLLVEYFLNTLRERYGRAKSISSEALIALMHNDYAGNVRELRNMVERIVIMTPGDTIELPDLPPSLRDRASRQSEASGRGAVGVEGLALHALVREYERGIIEAAVQRHGTTYGAAAALGVNQSTIVRKLKSYRQGT